MPAKGSGSRVNYNCSFCGKNQDQVRRLIAGPGAVYICDECVELCREIIQEDSSTTVRPKTPLQRIPPPKVIYQQLSEYVVGQEQAKKVLSVAVYNHYKRIGAQQGKDVELEKSNIMLLGPTGSGKTLLARTLAKVLDVPFTIAHATALTEAGYVGNVPRQGGRKHPHQDFIQINTGNVLFVLGGAFQGLDAVIDKRIGKGTRGMGFRSSQLESADPVKTADELLAKVTHDDLLGYGLIPEFVGRIPVVVSLHSLDQAALVRILTEPKNALTKQFQEFFALDTVELVFTDDALEAAAEEALRHKTGARGLRTVLEDCLLDVMYEIPSRGDVKKCVVDEDSIRGRRRPLLLTRSGQAIDLWGETTKETA